MRLLDNHFRELKYRRYFVGIAESRAEFGCKNKADMVYHSITTCITVEKSNSMWIHGEPNNYGGYGEWCVESRPINYRGLNSVSCYYTGTSFTICEFDMNCNAMTPPTSTRIVQTTSHKNINNDSGSEGQNQDDGTNDNDDFDNDDTDDKDDDTHNDNGADYYVDNDGNNGKK